MASEGQVQEETKVLKLKTNMVRYGHSPQNCPFPLFSFPNLILKEVSSEITDLSQI